MSSLSSFSERLIDWSALMAQYEQGTLDRKQFCQANHLSLRQFKYQRAKLKRKLAPAHQATLVPITIKTSPTPDENKLTHFQLMFQNGVRCQVPANFNSNSLKQLIEVLQSC